MSQVRVTVEQVRQVNADLINKVPKPQLSTTDIKLYSLVVSNGILPDDMSLRKIFKESRVAYGNS